MANKKISELNSATIPLTGTEEIAIVQGGETKKVAVSNLGGGSGSETYIFEYAQPALPTTTNWQVSNYNSSKRDEIFRNNTATTFPTLNKDVGSHLVRKAGKVTRIIFKMLRRNPSIAIDFNIYVGKFENADLSTIPSNEVIIANENIASANALNHEVILKEFTLISDDVNELDHLYVAYRNNTGVAVTLFNPQVIIEVTS